MAIAKAKLSYLRISPRKVRLVAGLIRNKKADRAQALLSFAVKKGVRPILKVLNSAIANAKNNFHLDPNTLFISKVIVDEGPKLKRSMPRARGSAYQIQKKTSHVTIILDEIKKSK
jgi:large subunit ribosomal protein L22